MLTATFASGGQGITNGYDALSRLTSSTSNMDGTNRSLNSGYDLADHRTSLTGDSGYGAWFGYFTTGELGSSTDSTGATIVSISLDSLGRRSALGLGVNNTSWAGYGYDAVSRLTSIARRFAVTGSDANLTFAYNPASQITSQTRDNDAYAWNGAVNVNRSYAANGLNQYTSAGSASYTYDANGNLTSDGTNTFSYDAENHMVSATTGGVTTSLSYDPIGRLWRIVKGSSETRFLYDGNHVAMEFDGSGNLLRSYVHGTAADEPLVWYEGSGASNRRFLSSDERGSVVAVMDGSGNRIALNSYDEYGLPGSSNQGRFQYTGQAWLSEIGMYYYKARMYSPTLGRFMQADPIGYGDGPNWYAYTHDDPVNGTDPTGQDVTYYCQGGRVLSQSQAETPDAHGNLPDLENCVGVPVPSGGSNLINPNPSPAPAVGFPGTVSAEISGWGTNTQSSSSGNPYASDPVLNSMIIAGYKQNNLAGAKLNWNLPDNQEQEWVVLPGNQIVYLGVRIGSPQSNGSVQVGVPNLSGTMDIVHTHPFWAEPEPGPLDYGHNIPIYGLEPNGVWVVTPGAKSATCLYGICR